MRRTILAAVSLFTLPAIADEHGLPGDTEQCTHTVQYTIYYDGDVADRTTYERNWPLSCNQSLQLKYETLRKLLNNGEAQWKKLTGQTRE